RVLRPAGIDADEKLEKDFAAQNVFQLLARLRADLLQHRAAPADENRLVRFALDVNRRFDDDEVLLFLFRELVDRHGGAVGNLLARAEKDFLAYDLGGEKALGLVSDLALGVVARPFGQKLFDAVEDEIDAVAFERGDRNDLPSR